MATAFWYGNAFISVMNKLIDIDSDSIKVSLHTSTYVPNQDTHDFWNDTTNEVSSANYTTGGLALTTKVSLYTGGTNVWNFQADNPSWTSVTFTTRIGVYYDSSPGSGATNPLLSYLDFGGDQSPSAANFTITHDPAGILKVTVS